MAYYGPNSEILGTIKMINWHYKGAIGENIDEFVTTISLFFAVDVLSFIINSIVLAVFCKVNVLKVIQKHQRIFWMYMAINEAYMFVEVKKPYLNFPKMSLSTYKSIFIFLLRFYLNLLLEVGMI